MRRFVASFIGLFALFSIAAAPAPRPVDSVTIANPTGVQIRESGNSLPVLTIIGHDGKRVTLNVAGTAASMITFRSCEHVAELAVIHFPVGMRITITGKEKGEALHTGDIGRDVVQCRLFQR